MSVAYNRNGEKESRMNKIIKAAQAWWESKRPYTWTEKEHLENPIINCITDQEKELAESVLNYLKKENRHDTEISV